ncbi:MAG: glutamine-hydrolyzing carbamoyl-phosphate synthase small subunit [Saprospiraceae bacterium]|nr:glutamine-hydrolyzing carbamoyl-phosphate synthase small subunit [Saprospiraceae bacterium]MBP7680219.1 glutamine-hydrolyzing carbamoyl-phosphate synthase small subunit [Saprospiraceae bacterium]
MSVNSTNQPTAVLLLEDGTVFHGKAAGKIGTTFGEICFNTGMTGYQEVFTDPSYFGQLLVATNVHIGNYGIKHTEAESDTIKIAGLICHTFTDAYSRALADESIQQYLESAGLVAITNADTRAIVRHIRSKGAMNGIISSENLNLDELKAQLAQAPHMDGLELASQVSTPTPYFFGNPEAAYKVAVLDLGTKKNILRCFAQRDCYLKVFPAKTPFAEIKAWNPDGYFLSNGPGDPATMSYAVATTKNILQENKPLFGICLGHQILSLAMGIPTYKMHHGHRGINHPVKNIITGRCEITSQNHGFSVQESAVYTHDDIEVTHINLNDNTIEGIRIKNKPAFSVQYHPEAAPGPNDARYLFDQFVRLIATNVSQLV